MIPETLGLEGMEARQCFPFFGNSLIVQLHGEHGDVFSGNLWCAAEGILFSELRCAQQLLCTKFVLRHDLILLLRHCTGCH